jgi:hypothetical protein
VACLSASLVGTSAGAGREVSGFSDGEWSLTYVAELEASGTLPSGSAFDGNGSYHGHGGFRVRGGTIVEGAFTGGGFISVFVDAGTGTSNGELAIVAEGTFGGAAGRPFLDGSFVMRGSFSIASDLISLTVPVSQTWTDQYPLDIYEATCEWVTGEWTAQIRNEGAAAAGISASGPAYFSAFRLTADEVEPFRADVEALVADVDAFFGIPLPADPAALDAWHNSLLDLLARAEHLIGAIPVLSECGGREAGAHFTSLLEAEIRSLLGRAVASFAGVGGTPAVRAALLADLASAGYRSGAIGTGSSWDDALELEADLQAAMDALLTEAIAAGDTAAIEAIEAYARSFAWDDIAARARGAA